MAAELIDAGVDVGDTYRRLYERMPIEKLRLVARAIEKIQRLDECALALTYVSERRLRGHRRRRGPDRGDHRPRPRAGGHGGRGRRARPRRGAGTARKVSLRSTDGDIDVSAIARVHGGGGHRRAAGFTTDLSYEEIVQALCAELEQAT